jgi:NADPH-dependent 2,4-dienoyl-CoA reductase/sulfur reductase-like enzyme/nitrite reductase/ring-hydroxylating ferredoxin subunit
VSASTPTPPTGPDLGAGIPLDDLDEARPILGHVDGEPVLIVRRDDLVTAIGATCSHYGGPLAEGLLVGDTIRCPWHHACFSLTTGEALGAPALSPVACYEVGQAGGVVRITGKKPPTVPVPRAAPPAAIVVVGAGAAGNAAAERLRRLGYAGALTMVGADADPPYDRPNLSKDYLAGNAPEEWIPLRPPGYHADLGVDLVTGVAARAIDLAAHTVTLADGRALAWDRLLLATGAEPVRLGCPGAELPHVFTLRTLADSRAIIRAAAAAKRAVVVGASFIGLEVAAALRQRGLEVAVVAPDARPFEKVLGKEVGDYVRGLHEDNGVDFHLKLTVASIERDHVTLSNGERLEADLVVAGVGVRPNVELAERAGLALDRGVLVDARLATSAPGVFAAGDVARYPDPRTGAKIRVEHWAFAERMGQHAARTMLGDPAPFEDVPFFWSAHYDVVMGYVGHAERWDRARVIGSLAARDAAVAYLEGEEIRAVLTIGRDLDGLLAENAFERGDRTTLATLVDG